MRRVLIIFCLGIMVAGGAVAWYFELGVSSEVKRQRFIKSAHESLSQGKIHEAITALTNAAEAHPPSAKIYHELGMAYLRAGAQREAFKSFLRAIELDSNLIPPRFQVARLHASRLALAEADEHLIKIREINPEAIEAVLLSAEIALAERNLDRALGILREGIARHPNESVFHMNTAAIYVAKEDYKSAEAAYKKALVLDPKSLLARAALSSVYQAQGNQEKAEQELLTMAKAEPENEELLRVLGNFYIRTSQIDQVERLYRDRLQKKPGSILAMQVLAELSFRKDDLQQARWFTDAILKAAPNDIQGRFFRARLLLAEKDYEKAIQLLSSVLDQGPDHAPAYFQLGLLKRALGSMNEARVAFKKATELSPNWVAPRLELAKLYLVTGDYGLAWLEIEKALKIYPDSPEALFLAAQTQFKQGQYDGALKLFSRLHKDDPKNPAIHMGLGALYAAQQKFGAALKAYEEVLRIDPDRVDALNSIAQLLVQEGKSREALARVERQLSSALSSAKDQTAILNILGDLSVEAGDAQKGIGYFKRALAINPSLAPTYLKIGSVYAGQRALDDAIEAYLKAVELAPKALQPRMMLAIMYEQKNEFSKANEAYQSILDINGKFAPAANNLAWNIAEHGGNLDVALRWAQTARENDPYNATVVDTLGWVMYRRGAFALAITLLEQSSNQFGNKNPSVLYHLGMAYYGAGKRQEAHKTLTKALALSREFKGADEAVKTVAELGGS